MLSCMCLFQFLRGGLRPCQWLFLTLANLLQLPAAILPLLPVKSCSQLCFGCFHMILQEGLSIVAFNVLIDLLDAFFYMFQC